MVLPVIRAYRGDVRDVRALVDRVRGKPIQLLRADRVYGVDHLRHAAALAARAIVDGRARGADLATETLLYAAGERQVSRALALLGLAEGARGMAAVSWDAAVLDEFARAEGWVRDDALLEGDESVLDAFGIGAQERTMIPRARWGDLILEKVALADVLKA